MPAISPTACVCPVRGRLTDHLGRDHGREPILDHHREASLALHHDHRSWDLEEWRTQRLAELTQKKKPAQQ